MSIFYVGIFRGLLSRAIEMNTLHAIKIARGTPILRGLLSHMFFANKSLFLCIYFCRVNQSDTTYIQSNLQLYQNSSGQLVNMDKSDISFSWNVPNEKENKKTSKDGSLFKTSFIQDISCQFINLDKSEISLSQSSLMLEILIFKHEFFLRM